MSYFIKNGAGQCYSDKEGYTPLKYAGVLSESTKSISSITGTPYIAIKDASCPVNCDTSVTSYSQAVNLLNAGEIETKYHRCIFVGSFQSRSEDYTISWNSEENRIDSTLNWKNKTWNYKELFAGDKSIVSYLTDRNNGDVLSFKLKDHRSLENYFRPLDSKTYGPVTSDTTDKCLLSNYVESWKGNGDTDAYNELDTDLSASTQHTVYYFRQTPETQKPKFGYTFQTNSADINNKGDLSYFTLDLSQIPNNKKHLKLQYFWNVLFNSQTQYTDPMAEIQNSFEQQSLNCDDGAHMFLYNYQFSNNTAWNTSDSDFKYKLGENLKSSIYKDVNDNWSADDKVIDGTFKTFKNSNPELDYWNDVKTYNRLYVTWANNEGEDKYENNDKDAAQKIFVNGDNGKKYITTIGCIWRANDGDLASDPSTDTYRMNIESGTSASVYFNAETGWILAEAKKNIVAGDSFNADDWTIIDKSLYMVTAHKYNITEGWLSAQNNWGPYSGSFIPYVNASDNYCHWDYDHSTENYSFIEPPKVNFYSTYLWIKKDSPLSSYDSNILSDKMSKWNGEPWVKDGVVWTINKDKEYHFNVIYISVNVKKDGEGIWKEYNYPPSAQKGYIIQRYRDKKFFRIKQDTNLSEYVHENTVNPSQRYIGDLPWSDFEFPPDYPDMYKCMEEITEEELFDINYSYDDYNLWDINTPPYPYEDFSREKCYSAGTYVNYFGDSYIANVDVMSGYGIDSMAYNESLFSFKNSRINQYKLNVNSYNYIGHSEYKIDLTDVTGQYQYIHISNPATYLFGSDLGCSGNMNPFVTDFKMTYEAID